MPDHRQKKLQKHKKKRAAVVRRAPAHAEDAQNEALQKRFLEMAVSRPFGPCFVTRGWDDEDKKRMHCVVVTHELDDTNLLPATFLVDLGCEGIKDAFAMVPVPQGEGIKLVIEKLAEWFPQGFVEAPPHVASAIVVKGLRYAEKLGFETSPKIQRVLAVLDSSEYVMSVEVPLGRRDKPVYAPEPDDDTRPVVQKLVRAVGPDGFVVELPEKE